MLVTGHYVQRLETPDGPVLARAADADRDQSYFLFGITRAQLQMLRFPIGGLKKSEVRDLARKFGLPIAEKADSQDICFVPAGRYSDIIAKLKPGAAEPGDIVHVDGRTLGRHEGIIHYTVGQRRGLKIPGPEPLYVVRLEPETNTVVVGPRSALETKSLVLRAVNWLGEKPLADLARDGFPRVCSYALVAASARCRNLQRAGRCRPGRSLRRRGGCRDRASLCILRCSKRGSARIGRRVHRHHPQEWRSNPRHGVSQSRCGTSCGDWTAAAVKQDHQGGST